MVRRRLPHFGFSHRSAAAITLAALCAAPVASRPLTIEDMSSIVTMEQPAISPDASRVALVVVRRGKPSLILVDAASGAQTTIARGGSVADPRWSPDGMSLAYLQRDRVGGHLQLFVVSARSPAKQITHSPSDVVDAAWRPDGREFAFAQPDVQRDPGYFEAGDNDYTAAAATPPIHLWLVASTGGTARRLTSGTWTIPPTDSSGIFSPQFAWTPDGGRIVFTRVHSVYSGDDEYSTLWIVDTASGALRKVTSHTRLELSPSYAPNRKSLLYWYARDGDYLSFNTLRLRTGTAESDVTAHFDYNAAGALWMPDGRSLLTCANNHTMSSAFVLSTSGSARKLNLGDINMVCDSYMSSTFDSGVAASVAKNGVIAFLGTSARHARELYILTPPSSQPHVLTHENDSLARLDLGTMQEMQWRGRGGFTEYGVVTFPPRMDKRGHYPILVNVHGGPGDTSLRSFAWEEWPRTQLFAAAGYIVFEPNYRGSDNAGNAFARAIYRDTVSGPSDDILRGLAQVRKLPQAQPQRISVCGWSYGGLLTSWLITQHHFWRAAVSGAAVNNEIDEYALSTSNVQNRYYLGSSPYVKGGEAIYLKQSPLTYADRVSTPTLLWSTTLDPVVPIPQMYEFYHALREHAVPVKFVIFPASGHGPQDQTQTATLTRLWIAWLNAFTKAVDAGSPGKL